jgi:hypothetical protein
MAARLDLGQVKESMKELGQQRFRTRCSDNSRGVVVLGHGTFTVSQLAKSSGGHTIAMKGFECIELISYGTHCVSREKRQCVSLPSKLASAEVIPVVSTNETALIECLTYDLYAAAYDVENS